MTPLVHVYARHNGKVGVCCPSVMMPQAVATYLDQTEPIGLPGIRWKVSPIKHFGNKQPNPCACEDDPFRLHRLFEYGL